MVFSKFYESVEVVLYIAINSGANPVISKEICEYMGVKPRHLEPIMQQLVKHGVLKGTKGPKGGYTLAKEKRKLNCLDIYKATTSGEAIKPDSDKNIKNDIIIPFSEEVNECLCNKLQTVTIEELCGKTTSMGTLNNSSGEFNI